MMLMTKEIRKKLPGLLSQEKLGKDAVVQVKYFTPDANWTWYATEFDGEDIFFGLVDGHCKELGSFSLRELESARGPVGLPIERDLYWTPKTLAEIAPELFAPLTDRHKRLQAHLDAEDQADAKAEADAWADHSRG